MKNLTVLRFIVCLILFTACEEDTIDPEAMGSLNGQIMNGEGKGLLNVSIETNPSTSTVMTDSTGAFTIENISVGEYAVIARKEGFRNQTTNITVRKNHATQVVMAIEKKAVEQGSIQGTVLDAKSNMPIANANITTSPPSVALLTNTLGQFTIDTLTAGNYTVRIKKNGYVQDSIQIAVGGGKPTEVNMLVNPSNQTLFNLPTQPSPLPLAAGLSDSLTLGWEVENPQSDALLTFDVLLYESGNPVGETIARDVADTNIDVSGLSFNTTYFWQVIAKDQHGSATPGDVWSFQTMPFPDISLLFTKRIAGSQKIYAADETLQHQIRFTQQSGEETHPRLSANGRWIAYTATEFGKHQIFVMRQDGTEKVRVSEIPVTGYHNYGSGFCWSPDGGQLLYSHYNKLYRINRDGSNLTILATAPEGRHFKACEWSDVAQKIVVQTIGTDINNSEFYLMNEDGSGMELILDNMPGRMESPSFSIDGKNLLFTQDKSGFTSTTGRQLDARVFMFSLENQEITDLSVHKPEGTNDTHPRFSPNGAFIIFEHSSNELNSAKNVWKMDVSGNNRQLLIANAQSPDWG